ncbi:hypothetical protein ZHAS_00009529 [Anopheles sinensis]|uniref:Uncharacterized protein n=1 Tax=Anopheles sinensis TaxID=74873 RepID=A0A084VVG7_ANOSI|nr:hypothetical protein ZHAS_00009529 [Anopheles sinensis]
MLTGNGVIKQTPRRRALEPGIRLAQLTPAQTDNLPPSPRPSLTSLRLLNQIKFPDHKSLAARFGLGAASAWGVSQVRGIRFSTPRYLRALARDMDGDH